MELLYPKLVKDGNISRIRVNKSTPTPNGFKFNENTNFFIDINKKSIYIEGLANVTRNTNITTNTYLKIKIPNMGYDIKNIHFAPYESKFSIVGDILTFSAYFDPSSNNFHYNFQNFIPII